MAATYYESFQSCAVSFRTNSAGSHHSDSFFSDFQPKRAPAPVIPNIPPRSKRLARSAQTFLRSATICMNGVFSFPNPYHSLGDALTSLALLCSLESSSVHRKCSQRRKHGCCCQSGVSQGWTTSNDESRFRSKGFGKDRYSARIQRLLLVLSVLVVKFAIGRLKALYQELGVILVIPRWIWASACYWWKVRVITSPFRSTTLRG